MKKTALVFLITALSLLTFPSLLTAQETTKKSCFDLYLECARNCVTSCRECETTSTGYQMCGTDFKCSGSCIAGCGNAQRDCEREEEATGQPLEVAPTPASEPTQQPQPTEQAGSTEEEKAVLERVAGFQRLRPTGRDIEIPSMLVRPEDAKDIMVEAPVANLETYPVLFFFDTVQGGAHLLLPDGTKVVPKEGETIRLPLDTKFIVPDQSYLNIAYAAFGQKGISLSFDSAMQMSSRSQVALTEMVKREKGRFGAVFKVEDGMVRVLGRGAGKLPLGIASETGVMLGTKGTDFAFAFDKKNSLTIIEIYDGEVEVTNPRTNKTTTLASAYGKEIKRLEIAKDGTALRKIAVPQDEFYSKKNFVYKEKILFYLPIVIIFAVALGGVIWFARRKR